MPMPVLICLSTCPDAASAERIATVLVEERLAACVNILPCLRSVYRWQGEVEAADEALLLIKTSAEAYHALQARLIALHPHELPELLAVEPATGLPAYLEWVAGQTRPLD
ncbi:divalent-cation tolerance protein CutA [Thermomonas sp. HDW16]|uniref:divalent-cation tolerance protein CutA n=1 Tax=Thermomonas sp. HDW16 TaxID=2714945 RepID=UPI001407AEDB|nr:divalent-cation tolerance protein CutA [Thermomonas sp. HDW16]QIL19818.1 divalent-cation tolerance protein CutA [Thermomonas sp. HDW16]